ncbi:MAG: alpha/beta hydrolase [Alphaproteobacteria bacterium]|nr:alpha/beta hydrolase [Alphaproteobacteria bacterium]
MRRAVLALAALAGVSACAPLDALNALVGDDGYRRTADIAYGSLPRQRLDVYVPDALAAGGARPVVLFLYGGGWRSGDRADYRFAGEALTRAGFVAVIPDYRLYPSVRFPDFVADAARALAWTRAEIARHGGDPGRIALMGHSAGAHIAALLALDPRYSAALGEPPDVIRAVVGLAGPYAFDPLGYRSTRPIFAAASADEARPVAFARAGAPPFLLLHGSADGTVFPSNSDDLARALSAKGGAAESIVYPDIGHIGVILAVATPFAYSAPVIADTKRFLDKALAPAARGPAVP